MKSVYQKLHSFLLFCFLVFTAHAQENTEPDFNQQDLTQIIPPLTSLIDSALKHNPSVKFRDLQVIVNECKLRAELTVWSRNLGFQADVRNGTFNNFSTNTSEGQSPDLFATKSNQTNYGIGAYIKFPIQDLLNRKNQIKMAKAEVDQAVNMAEQQKTEVRQLVIKQYNEWVLKYKLLKIRFKYLETSKTNMDMAEREFKNGVIDLTEYARISEISTRAESDFEVAKTEFVTAYLILEEIVGVKFNLIK
jgi:outer membrane protein TolC